MADKPQPKRGDVQVDKDKSRWIVVGAHYDDGPDKPSASRVREGSLAARIIFGRDRNG